MNKHLGTLQLYPKNHCYIVHGLLENSVKSVGSLTKRKIETLKTNKSTSDYRRSFCKI